jgi:glycosyltransferase involved in cell wall biosynthesis
VVVNSTTTAATVSALLGRKADLHVCRPGRDTIAPSTGRKRERRPRRHGNRLELLTVGNLIPRKGHLVLFAALAAITDLDWRCTVVGGGGSRSYERKIRSRAAELGLQDRIVFAGRVPDGELHRLYRGADLFLFPSEYEGYGIALAEALSQGVPYVAWDRGAVGELVSLGGGLREGTRQLGGYLLPGRDTRAMSEVLRDLIGDRDVLEELSREAWALSGSLPKWRDTGICFQRVLETKIGGGLL